MYFLVGCGKVVDSAVRVGSQDGLTHGCGSCHYLGTNPSSSEGTGTWARRTARIGTTSEMSSGVTVAMTVTADYKMPQRKEPVVGCTDVRRDWPWEKG